MAEAALNTDIILQKCCRCLVNWSFLSAQPAAVWGRILTKQLTTHTTWTVSVCSSLSSCKKIAPYERLSRWVLCKCFCSCGPFPGAPDESRHRNSLVQKSIENPGCNPPFIPRRQFGHDSQNQAGDVSWWNTMSLSVDLRDNTKATLTDEGCYVRFCDEITRTHLSHPYEFSIFIWCWSKWAWSW